METIIIWLAIGGLIAASAIWSHIANLNKQVARLSLDRDRMVNLDVRERGIAHREEALTNEQERHRRNVEHERIEAVTRNQRERDELLATANERIEADRVAIERQRTRTTAELNEMRDAITLLATQKAIGFPWLADAIGDYFELLEKRRAGWLETKPHPARRAADEVRLAGARIREAKTEAVNNRYIIAFYEAIAPWLVELRDVEVDDEIIRVGVPSPVGEDEDPVRRWVADGEYKSLSSAERNDLALRRYFERHKTKWEIGRDYERYIGWRRESIGGLVEYYGITERFADLGRDLVVTYANGAVEIIQCKCWSKEKVIHEAHIFQLFGTKTAYELDHPGTAVTATLVTSTVLSDRARRFAEHLGIVMEERVPLDPFPAVKCNIARATGERIYHLPFDQQYDTTVIELDRGESYVWTASEAESLGFRRAFRWRGTGAAS